MINETEFFLVIAKAVDAAAAAAPATAAALTFKLSISMVILK